MLALVVAINDMSVGPRNARLMAIHAGAVRVVEASLDGRFSTTADTGHFFGSCEIGRGWVGLTPLSGDEVERAGVHDDRDV